MRRILILTLSVSVLLPTAGCYRCYVCTANTEYGEVEREVCGRKRDIQGLIIELEQDTLSVGPWVCE